MFYVGPVDSSHKWKFYMNNEGRKPKNMYQTVSIINKAKMKSTNSTLNIKARRKTKYYEKREPMEKNFK